MKTLTKIIAPALAASLALSAAVPASAAPYHAASGLKREIAQIDRQIDRAQHRHLLTQREAARFERQVDRLERLHDNFARGGFTQAELRILDQRIDAVQKQFAREIGDRDGWRDDHRDERSDDHRGNDRDGHRR